MSDEPEVDVDVIDRTGLWQLDEAGWRRVERCGTERGDRDAAPPK